MSDQQCPHCGAELHYSDTYFRGLGAQREKLGDIYRCPNHEGFSDEEAALAYEPDAPAWEEVVCFSSVHHVSGSFYTDKAGKLHEGYPC